MAKKEKRPPQAEEKSAAEYYRLNTQAVDDLVTANEENSPPVSEAEMRKYRSGPKVTLSSWVKAVLIKFWFAGAACFFFLWGLGIYLPDQLDQMVVLGLGFGMVTDLLTNNVFRFLAKGRGDNDRWMMFPQKKFITLPLNVLYAFLLLFLVVMTYQGINLAALRFMGADENAVPLGVEPLLFGVFATLWDLLLLFCKRQMRRVVEDAKKSAAGARRGR